MERKVPTSRALLLGCMLIAVGRLTAGATSLWDTAGPAPEASEWTTYKVRDPKLEAEVWRMLRSVATGESDRRLALQQFVDRGPRMVPLFFGILTGEVLDAEEVVDPRGEWADAEPAPGDRGLPSVEELVYEALNALPPEAVVDHMRVAATGDAPTEIRLLAARVLALTGGPEALDVMLEILASMDPLQLQRPYLRGPFGIAVAQILLRHPGQLRDLSERLEELNLQVVLLVVEALPRELVSDGVPCVLSLFGRDAELDLALMEQLADFASSPMAASDTWSNLDCMLTVRMHLESDDWRMRCRAAVTLSKLRDIESLETLVRMFGDEHRSVQRTALWSLRELTGQRFEADAQRWSRWIAAERAWFAGPCTEIEWQVLANTDADVLVGIRALHSHYLYRDYSADLLGSLLLEASPAVFGAARAVLIKLESPRAVPHLVLCLDASEEYKRVGAWSALKDLTELNLPPERVVWQNGLGI